MVIQPVPAKTSGVVAPRTSSTRVVFLDQLRVALIILVVLHHLSVIYAANTAFYYLEPA
jgi:glucans biosynthesis protein C